MGMGMMDTPSMVDMVDAYYLMWVGEPGVKAQDQQDLDDAQWAVADAVGH